MRGLNGKNVIVTGGAARSAARSAGASPATARSVGVFDKNLDGAKQGRRRDQAAARPSCGVDITDYDGRRQGHRRSSRRRSARPTCW